MTPRRTIEIRTPVRALLIVSGLGAALTLGASAPAAAADDTLLQPTPLILKDGRIANVSVHVLSFPPGQSTLDAADARRLGKLSAELATDCFLTAQVIGHVGATEVGDDTLSAHRLARARADAVQASLIADGLPARAIASVWDWQFMVREPRATLWVFRLTPGEDCEGKPLESAAPALVAGAEPPSATTPASEPRPVVSPSSKAPAEQVASTSPDRGAGPASDRLPAPATVVRAAEAPRTAVAVPAGPARAPAAVPTVTQALPAVSPSPAEAAAGPPTPKPAAAEGEPAAHQVPEVVAALPSRPAEPAAKPAADDAGQQEVVITFPTNSSYFPPGTDDQLRALLQHVADQRYQVILEVSVSGAQKVVGAETPEDAAKYNRWLADRRVDRVRSWLDDNVKDSALVVKPEYRANDDSRQIVVRIAPTA
jgi:outer membrane protein OmpA-like peptidoglycan-associated protein